MIRESLTFRSLGALSLALVFASCASVHPSARRPQASDVVEGSGQMVAAVSRAIILHAVEHPITTARTGFAMSLYRPLEAIRSNLPASWIAGGPLEEEPGSLLFERMLDRKKFPRAIPGKLKWLVDGKGFFPELNKQIIGAKKSIKVQIYIFDNDDIGIRCADMLKRRSSVVSVEVLFDDLGTTFAASAPPVTLTPRGFSPPADIEGYLTQDSNVRVRRIINPWLIADHTKLLLFDHHTAIIGGMNIGREYYSEWHDLMVRVEGPIVSYLDQEFSRAWDKARPRGEFTMVRTPVFDPRNMLADDCIPLRVVRTDPAEGRYEILDSMLLAIRGARRRVWIENPYFASDEIVAAVANAAQRGVDVRVVLPVTCDSRLMDASNLATASFLIEAGVKVFRYPQMAHTKAMICDGWASVGSANLDILSLRINRELNLTFTDPQAVRSLEKALFLPDFKKSGRLDCVEAAEVTNGIAETLADQF